MGLIKGRKLYESQKLAAVSSAAADAYAWLLPGICDDWGRFDPRPRSILGVAYTNRPDMTEPRLRRILDELEEVGLFRRYQVDSREWAEWTNYQGDPASRREHHSAPEPPWSDHAHTKACKLWREARLGYSVGRGGHINKIEGVTPQGSPPRGNPERVTAQGSASVPSVPSVPSGTDITANQTGGPRRNPLVDVQKLVAEGYRLITEIAAAGNEDPTVVLARCSTGNGTYAGRRKVNLESMSDDRLAQTLCDLRNEAAKLRAGAPAVDETREFYAKHGPPQELASACATKIRGRPDGVSPGDAVERWLDEMKAPHHVRIEVKRRALDLVNRKRAG